MVEGNLVEWWIDDVPIDQGGIQDKTFNQTHLNFQVSSQCKFQILKYF